MRFPDFSNHLKNKEFKIFGFRHIPKNRVIGRLLPCLYLTERDAGIGGGIMKHGFKKALRHKMRTGTGSQIASAREQLHRLHINLLISANSVFYGISAFSKRGRIENDIVIITIS